MVDRGYSPELRRYASAGRRQVCSVATILVGPPGVEPPVQPDLDARLGKALEVHSVKDAAAVVSAETGQPRRKVYARAIELSTRQR